MSYVYPRNTRTTKGRCKPCTTTYHWSGLPRHRDARCSDCGAPLSFAHPAQRGRLLLQQPASVPHTPYQPPRSAPLPRKDSSNATQHP